MAKLNYNVFGEGEPLIVLHGLFGSGRNWNTVAKSLGRDRQVITVDLRNHGESENSDSMTFADMVEDIHGLMNDLGLPAAALLGHSLGGKTAMAFALSHSDRTNALIVVDIAPAEYQFEFRHHIDTMMSLPLAKISNRTEADQYLRAAGITDTMIRQFLLQNLVRDGEGYAWQLNLPALRSNMQELAAFPGDWPSASYKGPALFLAGGESDYILPRHYTQIAGQFPRAVVKTIEDAGHWVHAEKPEAFVEAVRTFLSNE